MEALKFLEKKREEMISFTQELVRINSAGRNETAVSKAVQRKLRKYGIKSRLYGIGGRKGLIAETGKGKRTLVINGHIDTVPIGDPKKWRYPPLSGKIVGSKLYGRGSYDMKSGAVAATFAFIAMHRQGVKGLVLVLSQAEEGGEHTGIRMFLNMGMKVDAAIIAEPLGSRAVRIGSMGINRLEFTLTGKTAHTASFKDRGVNAVVNAAALVRELDRMSPKYRKHRLFPPPKITPSMISGGIAINVVPDECSLKVDFRLSYGQDRKSLRRDIDKVLNKLKRGREGFGVKVREINYHPPTITPAKSEIVRLSAKHVEKVMGFKPRIMIAGGITDGAMMVEKGIPAVILGCTGQGAHAENEYADMPSILRAAKVYSLVAADFLK